MNARTLDFIDDHNHIWIFASRKADDNSLYAAYYFNLHNDMAIHRCYFEGSPYDGEINPIGFSTALEDFRHYIGQPQYFEVIMNHEFFEYDNPIRKNVLFSNSGPTGANGF